MEAPYIQGEDSHTYGGEDLDFEDVADDESQDSSVQATGLHREVERERERWKTLNLEEKFKEVITLLTDNWRWSGELDLTAGSHRKLLEGWMKQSLLNDWLESDRTSPTFLHLLARKGKEFRLLHKKDRLTMVKDALEHRTTTATSTASRPHHYHQQHLAQPRNSHEEPVMNLAVFSDNNAFIDCVIDCWPDGVSDLIKETCRESRNCLHNIFMTWRPNRPPSKQERIKAQHIARISALEKGKKLLPWASAEAITAKDNTGNTPLHYAMWFRQCSYRDEDYVQMVRNMLEKGDYLMEATGGSLNQAGQSPILYYHHTAMSPKGVKEAGGPNKKEAVPGPRLQLQPPVTQPPTTSKEPQHHKSLNSKTQLMERPKQLLEKLPMQGHFIQRPVRKPAIAPPVSNDTHHNNRATGRPREEPTLTSHGSRPPTPKPIKATAWDSLFSIDMPPPPISRAATTTIANAAPDDSPEQTPKRTDERQQGGPENLSGPKLIDIFTKHYIRTRSDLEARNLIYGLNKSEVNLLLDASNHDKASDIVQLMNRMSHGGFSNTLSLVCIPTVAHDDSSQGKPEKSTPKAYPMNHRTPRQRTPNPNLGLSALIKVFDRLHSLGVRDILRLEVEDRRHPSHTDSAIEMALQGRDSLSTESRTRGAISIETWDWRKPDMSLEVIAFAAPDVVEVNLYWSGNQAILRSWSCPEGILKLEKLKTIRIVAAPGLETMERMDKLLGQFEIDIRRVALRDKQKPHRTIKVEIRREISGLMRGLESPANGSSWISGYVQGEKQHDWIERMEEFRSALRGIHDEFALAELEEPPRVNVALIDDGVDLSRLDSYYSKVWNGKTTEDRDIVKARGVTYCLAGRQQTPWNISSRGHGTIMANMILRINPWVSLYSMRIQDGQDNDGRRTIFAGSAANAIRGAISRDVHIISMSWSVRIKQHTVLPRGQGSVNPSGVGGGGTVLESEPGILTNNATMLTAAGVGNNVAVEESPYKMLEDAVEEATKQQIIMFCSATDDIQAGATDFLPYQKAQGYMFRIGAATAQGQRDPRSEDEKNIDYFFPGNQVAEALQPRSERKVRYHDGSSVSTALAAGLSSLLMYLAIVVRTYYGRDHPRGKWSDEQFQMLQRRTNMKKAFDNIESEAWPDKKFLPVWEAFGQVTPKIKKAKDLKDKMEVLYKLVSELCHKLK